MSKGDTTRSEILRQSAAVFNRKGYFGTALADVMTATGLKKGGIYNHFGSKDELAVEAFDYSLNVLRTRWLDVISKKQMPSEQLTALIEEFCHMRDEPFLAAGCPLLNTAVDSDDAHPELRERVHDAFVLWHGLVRRIVARGIEEHEFRADTDADRVATLVIMTLEGAMAVSGVFEEAKPLDVAREHLREYIGSELRR